MIDPDASSLVLIADDDDVTLSMVSAWLAGSGYTIVTASDGEEALRLAAECAPDLLLLDVVMPVLDGYAVCRAVQAGSDAPPPVIFLTAQGQAAGVAGFDAGAMDYILKPFERSDLLARVASALRTKAERDRLVKEAAHDVLTGLLNRRELDVRVGQAIALAQRHGRPLSCLLLDLDHFKDVNDLYGHAAGDMALRETGRRLGLACRISDVVARYGGEEFALLLPETPPGAAVVLADKLRFLLADTPVETDGARIWMRASIGVAAWRESMKSPTGLLAAADQALYRAKDLGRDRTELFDPMALSA